MMNADFDLDTRLRLLREAEARAVEASGRRCLALEARSGRARAHDVSIRRQTLLAAVRRSLHLPGIRGVPRPVHHPARSHTTPLVPHLVAVHCQGSLSHGHSRCPQQ
jgi:hypothetical protein